MLDQKPQSPFSTWRHWGTAGWVLFPLATVIGITVGLWGGEQRGWVAGFLTGALVILVRVAWPLHALTWFRLTVAFFVAVDVFAIIGSDWQFTDKWNGHSMSGLALIDFWAMMGIVYGLYRLNYGPPDKSFVVDDADLPTYSERDDGDFR